MDDLTDTREPNQLPSADDSDLSTAATAIERSRTRQAVLDYERIERVLQRRREAWAKRRRTTLAEDSGPAEEVA